jgi:transposase
MARAKAEGKRVSRPRIPQATQREIAALHTDGVSINQISKRLGVSYGTAWNYAKRSEANRAPTAVPTT